MVEGRLAKQESRLVTERAMTGLTTFIHIAHGSAVGLSWKFPLLFIDITLGWYGDVGIYSRLDFFNDCICNG